MVLLLVSARLHPIRGVSGVLRFSSVLRVLPSFMARRLDDQRTLPPWPQPPESCAAIRMDRSCRNLAQQLAWVRQGSLGSDRFRNRFGGESGIGLLDDLHQGQEREARESE